MDRTYPAPGRLDTLQIEITTHCNLRCLECTRTLASRAGTWRNEHMGMDSFERIIRNAPPARVLIVQGVGEPALHPDLPGLLATARASGKFGEILFYTNGLARPASYFLDLLRAGLSSFIVSLDSLDAEVAESCRRGTDVERLLELLRGITGVCTPRVSIVLSRMNLDDLPRTLAVLDGLGPVEVSIQPLANFRPDAASGGLNEHMLRPRDVVAYRAMKKDFPIRFPSLTVHDGVFDLLDKKPGPRPSGEPRKHCDRPFTYPYVTVEGYLTPCCLVYDPGVLGRTSLASGTFAGCWAAPPVQDWLRELVEGTPEVCRECILNPL